MKQVLLRIGRVMLSLMTATILLGTSLAATPTPVVVSSAAELDAALGAASSGDTIAFAGNIDIGSGAITIPSGVTIDLLGFTLGTSGGVINVYGSVSVGTLSIVGGTLLRQSGSNIDATISLSNGGAVRVPVTLSLENLDKTSGETIDTITYGGGATDSSSYVQKAADGVIYVKAQSNNSTPMSVIAVLTSAGNYFRLGTKNTDTLSLRYDIDYGGLAGATLPSMNPTSYTASDAAIQLMNPAKDGYVFSGWICEALGVVVPTDPMIIPEGAKGNLTCIAVWEEDAAGGGRGGISGGSVGTSGTTTTDDAETQQEAAAAADQTTAASSSGTKRIRVASSSTKVTFTSDVDTVMPTLESVRGQSFPWGIVLGGLSGLGVVVYIAVKLAERKKQ